MIDNFGHTPEGETVQRLRLRGGGLTAHVLTYGATVQDLHLNGHAPPLTLGFDNLDSYVAHSGYFGAIVGRYANRIGGGAFTLDGKAFRLNRNFRGRHLLHGGARGFDRRVWSIVDHGPDFVALALRSPDGEMGFPGAIDVSCTYRLTADSALSVELAATADAPTLANFAHHSYFNLDDGGAGTIAGHRLEIAAESYLPVDDDLIPTGEIRAVAGAPFDFRAMRPIGDIAFDHNFCLAPARRPLTRVARVEAARSGLVMEVRTTEPGVQFYAGGSIAAPAPGLDGIAYRAFSGLCLEPQIWPDAPNQPEFPQAVLRPGEIYRQSTAYAFSRM